MKHTKEKVPAGLFALPALLLLQCGISCLPALAYTGLTLDAGDFDNTYSADAATAYIQAKKELEGRDLEAGEFTFLLTGEDGEVVDTAVNDSNGSISFDGIEYDETGTWTYTITEEEGDNEGITYDDAEFDVTVTVGEDEGELCVSIDYEEDPLFVNTYAAEDVSVQLTAWKVLNGADLGAGDYLFILKDEDGAELDTVVNRSDGSITFDELTFYEAGEYTFYMSEMVGSDANTSYDTHTYEVDVTITDNGNGTLSAVVSDIPTFTNTYVTANASSDTSSGTSSASAADTSVSDRRTGDTVKLGVYVGVVIAALAGTLLIAIKKWKR